AGQEFIVASKVMAEAMHCEQVGSTFGIPKFCRTIPARRRQQVARVIKSNEDNSALVPCESGVLPVRRHIPDVGVPIVAAGSQQFAVAPPGAVIDAARMGKLGLDLSTLVEVADLHNIVLHA